MNFLLRYSKAAILFRLLLPFSSNAQNLHSFKTILPNQNEYIVVITPLTKQF